MNTKKKRKYLWLLLLVFCMGVILTPTKAFAATLITAVNVGDINQPAVGTFPDVSGTITTVPANAATIKTIEWRDWNGQNVYPSNQVFVGGRNYTLHITMVPNPGYEFSFIDATETNITFNGFTVQSGDNDTENDTDLHAYTKNIHLHGNCKKSEYRPATCTETGRKGYYQCSGCLKCFEDEACTKPIDNLGEWQIIPMTAHTTNGDWVREQLQHWKECSACGSREGLEMHDFGDDDICDVCGYDDSPHIHSGIFHEGYAATCTEAGEKDYYSCDCGKYFHDSACTNEIGDIDTWKVISPLNHDYSVLQNDKTDHWYICSRCDTTTEKESHSYNNDNICDTCGYEKTIIPPTTEQTTDSTTESETEQTTEQTTELTTEQTTEPTTERTTETTSEKQDKSDSNAGVESPKTGDNVNLTILFIVFLLSSILLIFTLSRKKLK